MDDYEISNQTNTHFSDLFDDKLLSFRKGIGCEQVLVNVTEQGKNVLDKNMFVGIILMCLIVYIINFY